METICKQEDEATSCMLWTGIPVRLLGILLAYISGQGMQSLPIRSHTPIQLVWGLHELASVKDLGWYPAQVNISYYYD